MDFEAFHQLGSMGFHSFDAQIKAVGNLFGRAPSAIN